ncbi:DUF5906 domain-containing protein [Crenobacter cavernae]|uniref:NrS-1 polymerase-like helicase domain-containing protein n=1 Tax=Crenobacter cavernae TaxID=2290923 RepID=A0A345Y6T0_9NEIS|nr:DUF5906 domain-containing protein [Crenobacter cavernae]AXK39632.1 hypothetical protein DWG20_09350 [Crenobacter cavernae]
MLDQVHRQFQSMGMPQLPASGIRLNTPGWVRYGPGKKAFYKVREYVSPKTGRAYYHGTFGHKGEGPWTIESDWSDLDPAERQRAEEQRRREEERAEAKRRERAHLAANRAKGRWQAAIRDGVSPYLERKGITAPESVRFFDDGTLLIPLLHYGEEPARVVGDQRIDPAGEKRFPSGFDKIGAACRLGDMPVDGEPIGIGEGYATCMSGRMALDRKVPVFMALDSGNLLHVARIVRGRWPNSPIVFLADDDCLPTARGEDNHAGRLAAEHAAVQVGLSKVVLPVFGVPRRETRDDERLPKLTDFNDLHVAEGLDAVRAQLAPLFGLAEEMPSAESSPAPLQDAADADCAAGADAPETPAGPTAEEKLLRRLLSHCAFVHGQNKVWDSLNQQLMPLGAFKNTYPSVAKEWLTHAKRRTIHKENLPSVKRGKPVEAATVESVNTLLEHFVLIYGTETVWDGLHLQIVKISSLRLAWGEDVVKQWLEHPKRRMILQDGLVFDPTQSSDPETTVNLYNGFQLVPQNGEGLEDKILDHLSILCDHDAELMQWLLKWIAYPLQHPGAKMATAVVMHGPEGTGKSIFWEKVVKGIYGEYGITVGQQQIESQFTGWKSRKLFALFEEVLARIEKYQLKGTIKHLVTGETHSINEKMLPERFEANHLNAVFLSNELQPLALDLGDRRFCVVWASRVLPPEYFAELGRAIDLGAVEAFYHYLLTLDLTGFGPHAKPPVNKAKQRLINIGLPPSELFWMDWSAGELDVPFVSVPTEELYEVFKLWCNRRGEKHIPSMIKFIEALALKSPHGKGREWCSIISSRKQFTLLKVDLPEEGHKKEFWYGHQVVRFREGAKLYREAISQP